MNISRAERSETLTPETASLNSGANAVGPMPPNRRPTRLSGAHAALVIGAAVLAILLLFVVQNPHTVKISFAMWSIHVSLAVALLLASVAGGLLVGAVGGARLAQVRRATHRSSHKPSDPAQSAG